MQQVIIGRKSEQAELDRCMLSLMIGFDFSNYENIFF